MQINEWFELNCKQQKRIDAKKIKISKINNFGTRSKLFFIIGYKLDIL